MRHLQLITDDTTVDKKNSQRVIYGNTVDTLVQLLSLVEKLGLQVGEENKVTTPALPMNWILYLQ